MLGEAPIINSVHSIYRHNVPLLSPLCPKSFSKLPLIHRFNGKPRDTVARFSSHPSVAKKWAEEKHMCLIRETTSELTGCLCSPVARCSSINTERTQRGINSHWADETRMRGEQNCVQTTADKKYTHPVSISPDQLRIATTRGDINNPSTRNIINRGLFLLCSLRFIGTCQHGRLLIRQCFQ